MSTFPDVEATLVTFLAGQFPAARVCTELPANMLDVLPVVQVERVSGGDDTFRVDSPVVDVSAYAATRGDAASVAESVRAALLSVLGVQVPGTVVTGVRTTTGPRWLAYDDTNVRRYQATYQIFLHAS